MDIQDVRTDGTIQLSEPFGPINEICMGYQRGFEHGAALDNAVLFGEQIDRGPSSTDLNRLLYVLDEIGVGIT